MRSQNNEKGLDLVKVSWVLGFSPNVMGSLWRFIIKRIACDLCIKQICGYCVNR